MQDDRTAIQRLAQRLVAAEMTCDVSAFTDAFTDDAVILPPAVPAIVGREACLAFVRTVLEQNAEELRSNEIVYESAETCVDGALGFDRGNFSQSMSLRGGMPDVHVVGQYLRIYSRGSDGNWRLARMIWNRLEPDDEEPEQF